MRILSLSLFALLLLLACSNDTTEIISQSIPDNIEVVAEESDLPECNDESEGVQVMVKGESVARICVDGGWTNAIKPGKDTVNLKNENIPCYTQSISGGKGVKVVCNGDSVGVLFKGESGKKGEEGEDGTGCILARVDSLYVRLACESDSALIYRPDTTRVTLFGCAQKGPFLKGTSVALYEVSDSASLKQTGVNFAGAVDDGGCFEVTATNLSSQYAVIVAEGLYDNEVTGSPSRSDVRLRALVDVAERDTANVNVLTHLEFNRASYLVSHEGMGVERAKKQAQSEVLKLFFIDSVGFDASENLNIFDKGDADAALLAISVLLQGSRNEGGLMSLLTEISNALEFEGEWNGSVVDSIKTAMADWAMDQDLRIIRKSVEGWNNGEKVGNFEKYINNFIAHVYAMKPCGGGDETEQRVVNNERSLYQGQTFYCHEWTCITGSKNTFFNPDVVYGWMVDPRDKHAYRTVKIGEQTWMAENLNYEYKINSAGKAVTYGNLCGADSCDVYGRFYTYAAAMDSAAVFSENGKGCGWGVNCTPIYPVPGVCPEGWHLPDTTEYRTLFNAVGGIERASLILRSSELWPVDEKTEDIKGTDSVGFCVLPSGYFNANDNSVHQTPINGGADQQVDLATFMTSIEIEEDFDPEHINVYIIEFQSLHLDVGAQLHVSPGGGRSFGQSVRCIKDSAE
ncbi:MAG: hypothetical protein J6P30_03535 [Fibrobacter sp.]|nr:hypothetical protein [Fibrobacter sp.]